MGYGEVVALQRQRGRQITAPVPEKETKPRSLAATGDPAASRRLLHGRVQGNDRYSLDGSMAQQISPEESTGAVWWSSGSARFRKSQGRSRQSAWVVLAPATRRRRRSAQRNGSLDAASAACQTEFSTVQRPRKPTVHKVNDLIRDRSHS